MSKRSRACWAIVQHVVASGTLAAAPTVGLEAHKHVVLTGNDIGLCVRIAAIYAEEEISKKGVMKLLSEAGIASGSGALLSAGATKLGHAAINELLNFVPVVGSSIKASLAGSMTAGIGWMFMEFCEERFGSHPKRETFQKDPEPTAKERRFRNVLFIDFSGKITIGEGDVVLRSALSRALEGGEKRIIINMAKVPMIDASGLGELIGCKSHADKKGAEIRLLHLTSKVEDILEITRMAHVFEAFDDEEDALDSF